MTIKKVGPWRSGACWDILGSLEGIKVVFTSGSSAEALGEKLEAGPTQLSFFLFHPGDRKSLCSCVCSCSGYFQRGQVPSPWTAKLAAEDAC